MAQRRAYKWGAKQYLASMEIGETRIDDGRFNWRGLQYTAAALKRDYGSQYKFVTYYSQGYRTVTRLA